MPPHLLGENGLLKLLQRVVDDLAVVGRSKDPPIIDGLGSLFVHLELKPAVGALDRSASAADERVVELVLRLAAVALDVHLSPYAPPLRSGDAFSPFCDKGYHAVSSIVERVPRCRTLVATSTIVAPGVSPT